ncbi:MAG: hypothetical protein KDE62_11410, partial [Calditrichaeota bacterium]|nr:hypothetical protein [Calditrichota bacterium]
HWLRVIGAESDGTVQVLSLRAASFCGAAISSKKLPTLLQTYCLLQARATQRPLEAPRVRLRRRFAPRNDSTNP